MAVISWGDADGTWAIRSSLPGPGGRFQQWTPTTRKVGPRRTALGTPRSVRFTFRRDCGASFSLERLAGARRALTATGTFRAESVLDACNRLIERLTDGDDINVWPENGVAPTLRYQCVLRDGETPSLTSTGRSARLYALGLSVVTTDGVEMVYPYGVADGSATGSASSLAVPVP